MKKFITRSTVAIALILTCSITALGAEKPMGYLQVASFVAEAVCRITLQTLQNIQLPQPDTVEGSYDISQYTVPADFNQDGILTEDEVSQMMEQLQKEFPNGTYLGKAIIGPDAMREDFTLEHMNYYSDVLGGGGDCRAWAYYASDRIFGNLPVTRLSLAEVGGGVVRVGDLMQGTGHTTIAATNAHVSEDGLYDCNTSDSNASLLITWNGTCISPFAFESIFTRYPQ